ncbi:MAG: DegT/DnrJ/EryC1/StrS family aminotransferase [Thermodesulfovibrionia bacterium]
MSKRLAILGGKPAFNNKIYITRPVTPTVNELKPFLEDVIKRRWLTNDGPYVQGFERMLREYLGAKYCSIFCNGTLALQLAIQALRLSGEVITTPFTFPATPHVLYWNNITPVFCDIDPKTYNIDPSNVESLISPRTTGILGVHVFGNPCNTKEIERIARYHGLKVIYDAAHAFGVKLNGKSIANIGDAVMFSFHATKLFNTMEGGAITCSDANLDQRLRDLRNFGIRGEEEVIGPGINAKMNEFQAIWGIINLKKVEGTIMKRKALFDRYHSNLKGITGIEFQKLNHGISYNYAYMTIKISPEEFGLTRDEVFACMRKEGIMVRKYFYPLCSNYPCYSALPSAKRELLPNANMVSSRILCLPLYEEMTKEDVDKITDIILMIHRHSKEIKKRINP